MILRGAEIQRNGHGRCGLLPNRTFSSNRAKLPFPGVVLTHRESNLLTLWPLMVTSGREAQNWSDYQDRKPFHVTRARRRVVPCHPPDCPMSKGGRYVVSLQQR